MVAIIGGETRRFRPLIDLYHEAYAQAGHAPEQMKLGVHSLGYVAPTTQEVADDFYPGYAKADEKRRQGAWLPRDDAPNERVFTPACEADASNGAARHSRCTRPAQGACSRRLGGCDVVALRRSGERPDSVH